MNGRCSYQSLLTALGMLLCASIPVWAQMDSRFTYQGQLKENGDSVTDAVQMRFSLWDDLASDGQIGGNYTPSGGVSVVDGLFTVQIDPTPFGADCFNGEPRWLQIEIYQTGVGYVALTPRHPITPAPYALYAAESGDGNDSWESAESDIYYTAGRVGVGTDTPGYRLHVLDDASYPAAVIRNDGSGEGLRAESVSAAAILATSDYRGITAWAHNPGAYGIFAGSDAAYGAGAGVYGYCTSIEGSGVSGYAAAGSGNASGVYGITDSTGGFAVRGVANATSGLAEGGRFTSNASSGRGVYGNCTAATGLNYGVLGVVASTSGVGVYGAPQATTGSTIGVRGTTLSTSGIGVKGESFATSGATCGVYGGSAGGTSSAGVRGVNTNGFGGYFSSTNGTAGLFEGPIGVMIDHNAGGFNTAGLTLNTTGTEEPIGMEVTVDAGYGKLASFDLNGAAGYLSPAFMIAADNSGNVLNVLGENTTSEANVLRVQSDGYGSAISAYNSRNSHDAPAVHGYHVSSVANYGIGVKGEGGYKGVEGRAGGGDGTGTKYGVYGYATGGTTNYAGYFSGDLRCTGTLSKGSGTFMIDHPLDPENKYLYHSFVESPDMMNIYNGNAVTDGSGYATVAMPDWFEALNREFRYQLTVIDDGDDFVQVKIVREIEGNAFVLRSSKPNTKVSWQVTGVRQDPYANAHRVQVEVDKPADEIGTYLHPAEWGVSTDLQVDRVREARQAAEIKAIEVE